MWILEVPRLFETAITFEQLGAVPAEGQDTSYGNTQDGGTYPKAACNMAIICRYTVLGVLLLKPGYSTVEEGRLPGC